ncbi:MAG: hypothetical protein GZ088_16350 [Acidipila sp.]|nr:hypothetical protein [Acidipila sp.]
MMLAIMCFAVVALSAAGLVAIVLSRELVGVDALLLAMICLSMGALFAFFLFLVFRGAKQPEEPPAAQPAPPKA